MFATIISVNVGLGNRRMTEYVDKSNEELASEFIVGTCQLLPRLVHVVSNHIPMHNFIVSDGQVSTENAAVCGSFAEFYIRPLIGCVDDVDVLLVRTTAELVFSGGFPGLPSDLNGLDDAIKCFKIEPYDMYPGFVRLREWAELSYNWKLKKYEVNNYTAHHYRYAKLNLERVRTVLCQSLERRSSLLNSVSGPAIKQRAERNSDILFETDFVRSMRCPQWPKEANGWLHRTRNNGWPTIDIITNVVQSGCHLVYVQHRSSRNEDLQWRLSFSVAEVILLQSLSEVQQIVYHLLRFFAKRELIQKGCSKDDEVLCTYHLKTLMLWTCEDMPPEWWNSASIISICSELLKKLSEWLKRRHYPNYFIPEANLFHEPSNSIVLDMTEQRLNEFCNSEILCHWFVENYILSFIRSSFKPIEPMPHFRNYMLPLFECWKRNELKSLDVYIYSTFRFSHQNNRSIMKHKSAPSQYQHLKTVYYFRGFEFRADGRLRTYPTVNDILCFIIYENLLTILHSAYGLRIGEISWDSSVFIEVVDEIAMRSKIIKSQHHNFPKTYVADNYIYEFLRAQDLLRNVTLSTSRPEFQLLSLVSKELLRKALKRYGSVSNGFANASLSYLAALHYATSEYQEAMRLCSAVLVDQNSTDDKETLNAGCLLFIDDIARIVGLCVLQIKITEGNLHYINRRLYLDLRLSPEVFAYYLTVLSAEGMYMYTQLDFCHNLPMDVNLTTLIMPTKSGYHYIASTQFVYSRPDSVTEIQTSCENLTIVKEKILDTLMEYAVENTTSFYNVIRTDFGIDCNTADCYRALYLYNCRQYDDVLNFCDTILHEPDLQDNFKELLFTNVLLFPPLDSFFDRDVQSLLGFKILFCFLSPLINDLGKDELPDDSTFEHVFAQYVRHGMWELTSFLQPPYSIRSHYFVGRHFLARYLKLRCCLDSKLPYKAAMIEFAVHQTNLPLEHLIRRFLLRKIRILTTKGD